MEIGLFLFVLILFISGILATIVEFLSNPLVFIVIAITCLLLAIIVSTQKEAQDKKD